MKIDDLMDMTVRELLDQYCVVYSPECGYHYGITTWENANEIYEEYDLEEEYCFEGDYLIPLDYGFDCGEEVLTLENLKDLMDRLGIVKKQPCPSCGSSNYHLDYNDLHMLCNDCGYKAKESVQ